jgi:dihydropteroate synthase
MPELYAILGGVMAQEPQCRARVTGVGMMPRYLFVTGKLAARSLEATLETLSADLEYEIAILPISVAALMDTGFVAKHLANGRGCERVMIPGLCGGDLKPIADRLGVEVLRGPNSLKEIPKFFGKSHRLDGYGAYQTKIIAEIVNASELDLDQILERASYFEAGGADVIDLGCPVQGGFPGIGRVVKALKKRGLAVSVDSFNPEDVLNADKAGADYALSINSGNIEIARKLRCKVVVIPDSGKGIKSLVRSMERLEAWRVPYIVDPVLSPIGFGFARSLENFFILRRRYPHAEMLMGLGNLTELTEADTTGITAVMAGIISELQINYVLTTEVISWARGAVREMDIARRLMHYACRNGVLPKHLTDALITVKDPPFENFREDELRAMQAQVRDRNFRIFADDNCIYVFNNRLFVKGTDTQRIFAQLQVDDASQAFYLGKELEKAQLALKLGKRYVQESDLRWGYLSSSHLPPKDPRTTES